jgi:hypothetical protein
VREARRRVPARNRECLQRLLGPEADEELDTVDASVIVAREADVGATRVTYYFVYNVCWPEEGKSVPGVMSTVSTGILELCARLALLALAIGILALVIDSDLMVLLVLLPFPALSLVLYLIVVPRVHARTMRRDSGRNYNEKYKDILNKKGALNTLPVPEINIVRGRATIEWPHLWMEQQWRHYVHGVGRFGTAHITGILAATGSAVTFAFIAPTQDSELSVSDAGFPVAVSLLLSGTIFLLTWISPRLGRSFRSDSYLLSLSVVALWFYWIDILFGLFVLPQYFVAPLGIYSVIWLLLLVRWPASAPMFRMNTLVLRVFGSWTRSIYLFEVLQPLWNQIGSVFTVASPDQVLIRPTFTSRARLNISILLWSLLFLSQLVALVLLEQSSFSMTTIAVLVALVALLECIIVYWLLKWVYAGVFMKDDSDAYTALVSSISKPARPWQTHRNLHMACHNDDWQIVVEAMMSVSDCVLIDLRGFSRENSGVVYELGFAINNARLENMLGLADDSTDFEYLEEAFTHHWRRLSEESWNYSTCESKFTIYKRTKIRLSDAFDVSAWLMSKAYRLDLLAGDLQIEMEEGTSVPMLTWERNVSTDAWILLTLLPEGHPGFDQCPHGDALHWEQFSYPDIEYPITVRTQALQSKEDESAFWTEMATQTPGWARLVDEVIRERGVTATSR